MTLKEFDRMNLAGCMYVVVDADKTGFMLWPDVLLEADGNTVKKRFGNCEVIGFNSERKGKITVYVSGGRDDDRGN